MNNPLAYLAFSLGIQLVFFVIAFARKTDKLTDLSYGLTFTIISILLLINLNQEANLVQVLLALSVIIWGLRLISYLFVRIIVIKKDRRFDGIRESFLKFGQFWLLQGLSVWIILLPVITVLSKRITASDGLYIFLGLGIWLIGLIIETVADWQKFSFKLKTQNKGRWINTGLWAYSRHPNYFGEILCWWGLFITALPYLAGGELLVVIGPLFITSLLLFVSGIPPLEKRYTEIYAKNQDYQKYKRTTSLLIPLPPGRE